MKRKRGKSPETHPSTSQTRVPWWRDDLAQEYRRWWLPRERSYGSSYPTLEIPFTTATGEGRSWFTHRRYLYPSGSELRILRPIEANSPPPPKPKKKPKKTPSTKPAKSNKGRQRSKKVTPEGHVLRTWKTRVFPSKEQARILKIWLKAARATWNWALGVSRRQYARHQRTHVSVTSFEGLKKAFVTCHVSRVPRKLRWMKDTPCSVREASMNELAKAYKAQFERHAESGAFTDLAFRSAKRPKASITIPTQNWSTVEGKRWHCYVKMLPGGGALRVRSRDKRRILDEYPEGPLREVKLTLTGTNKWFLHIPVYKRIKDMAPNAKGHLVALDPGSNPLMTYYSPTLMESGSMGIQSDLDVLRGLQTRSDLLSSRMSSSHDLSALDGDEVQLYEKLRHRRNRKDRRRKHLLNERVQNRVQECGNKLSLYLCQRYQFVHASTFATEEMVAKTTPEGRRRRIAAQTSRDLLTWRHGPFKRALALKEEEIRGMRVVFGGEEYTTKTCDNCGYLQQVNGKLFRCANCRHCVHRDVHGARGHALKNCVGIYEWVS